MIEHIKEYLDRLDEISEEFGLWPTLDPKGDAFMLVNYQDRSRVVTWLNSEDLTFRDNAADVNEAELISVVEAEIIEE